MDAPADKPAAGKRVERTATAGTISTAPARRICDVCFADLGTDGVCPCKCEHCNRVPRMDRP